MLFMDIGVEMSIIHTHIIVHWTGRDFQNNTLQFKIKCGNNFLYNILIPQEEVKLLTPFSLGPNHCYKSITK